MADIKGHQQLTVGCFTLYRNVSYDGGTIVIVDERGKKRVCVLTDAKLERVLQGARLDWRKD